MGKRGRVGVGMGDRGMEGERERERVQHFGKAFSVVNINWLVL